VTVPTLIAPAVRATLLGDAIRPGDVVRESPALSLSSNFVILLAGIAVIAWLSRARRDLNPLPDATPDYSPGWAVAAWIIPIANLVMPGLVVADVAKNSAGRDGHGPSRGALLGLAWAWSACYAARAVVGVAAVVAVTDYGTGYWAATGSAALLWIIAGALLIVLMWKIGTAQRAQLADRDSRLHDADFPAFTVDHLLTAGEAPTTAVHRD
jgi:hypothetical protein